MAIKPALDVIGLRCWLMGLAIAIVGPADGFEARGQEREIYDHHVHLLSPELIRDWKSTGMPFSRADEFYSDPATALGKDTVRGAFLISMAHLYATEDFQELRQNDADEQKKTAAENDFIAACVAQSPGHYVGFFSISPLSVYAMEEMERCRQQPNLRGMKLHLPACGVDVGNPDHRNRLAGVLAWAAENDIPVLMHFSAGERISLERARDFWSKIIEPHENLGLYLAHLGSAGGYNDSTSHILTAFRERCAENAAFAAREIYFDMSGAIIGEDFGELPPTSDERCRQLSERMREVGVERFLFASDYPVFGIGETERNLAERLALTDRELEQLFSNRSPRFQRR